MSDESAEHDWFTAGVDPIATVVLLAVAAATSTWLLVLPAAFWALLTAAQLRLARRFSR